MMYNNHASRNTNDVPHIKYRSGILGNHILMMSIHSRTRKKHRNTELYRRIYPNHSVTDNRTVFSIDAFTLAAAINEQATQPFPDSLLNSMP